MGRLPLADGIVMSEERTPQATGVLHLLLTADADAWRDCARLATGRDAVIVLGEAVSALSNPSCPEQADWSCEVAVASADAEALGYTSALTASGYSAVSDRQIVAMSEQFGHSLSWS